MANDSGSFYITLPSNASMKIFKENTLTNYTTLLPDVIDLNGDYEVGLSEIHYPHNFNSIQSDSTWQFSITHTTQYLKSDGLNDIGATKTFIVTLEKRGFVDIRHLLETCNTRIKDVLYGVTFKWPSFVWDDKAHCVIVKNTLDERDNTQKFCFIECSPELSHVLGLNSYVLDLNNLPIRVVGNQNVSMRNFFDQIYVYSDICETSYLGDVKASLLRIIPIKEQPGSCVSVIYERIHYVPVVKNRVQSIQILLRTDTGEPIKFINGRVIVTLHFRRRRSDF